jgi:hypothetical protein
MLGDLNRVDFLARPGLPGPEDLDRQQLLDDWYGRLAIVAAKVAGSRASLKAQEENQRRALREARGPSVSAATLYDCADRIAEIEESGAREVSPLIEPIRRILEKPEPDPDVKIERTIWRYAEETIDLATSWLELMQNYRLECIRIASEKGQVRPIISSEGELERELAQLAEDQR